MATTEQKFLDYPGLEYYHQQNITTMDEKDVSVLDNSKSYTDSSVQAKGNELGTRIDNLILNAGDSSAECADARVTKDGTVHDTLKNRLDTEYSQLSSEIDELPYFTRFDSSLFSNGYTDYSTGEWIETIARVGTKEIIQMDYPIEISLNDSEYEYYIAYFREDDTFEGWSTWKKADSDPLLIPAKRKFKISVGQLNYQAGTVLNCLEISLKFRISTFLRELVNDYKFMKNNGVKIQPQLVRGFRNLSGKHVTSTLDYRNRYVTIYRIKYLYAGSTIYCKLPKYYRFSLNKYNDDSQRTMGVNIVNNEGIPIKENAYTIKEDGFYSFNIIAYNGADTVDIDHLRENVIFNLYSDCENNVECVFIGGGKNNFQAPGDSTLFIGKTGKTLLIDSPMNNVQGQLLNALNENGVDEIDYFIFSHMHDDHIASAVILLENSSFPISLNDTTVFLPSQSGIDYALENNLIGETSQKYYNRLMTLINNATNCNVIRPTTEFETYNIDGFNVEFWNVNHSVFEGVSTNYNDWSLCCNIVNGNQRICMTGDIGVIAQSLNIGKNYKCNIYKTHHHGWDNTTNSEDILNIKKWMSTVYPEIIISEDGIIHDTYLKEDTSPLQTWCEENNVPNYRTNQNGFINVSISKNSFDIKTPVIRYIREEN